MQTKKDYTYVLILSLSLCMITLAIIYIKYFRNIFEIPDCIIYKNLGMYCIGCGCTRAVYSLYDGNILKSIYYNPIIVYTLIIMCLYLVTETISKIMKKENKFISKKIDLYIYNATIILIINWLVKIIMICNGIRMQ